MNGQGTSPGAPAAPAATAEAVPKRGCGPIRPSRSGRKRAAVLIGIHVVVALHVLHWKLTGRTLTPAEPSESIQTLSEGLVNAGFVLFALLILGTLVLGRWFCGWGCHIVALQDLCTWILRKLGIRPRPFRSRLLVWVPLLAAVYMFVLPVALRLVRGAPAPEAMSHFTTDSFWARFPGPWIAVITFLVCGFVVVVVLGNKGFCTYGCPYGGVFSLVDHAAAGRIRVTDACEGCGHCTATCTSNVRVHEEVKLYGMVVDPGCMKCTDCISVCPKDALYYGFGRPAAAKGAPRGKAPGRRYDFTVWEEIGLALLFLVTLVVLVDLYNAVPLLLALGASAIGAYFLFTAIRMGSRRNLRFARFQIRAGGRTTRAGVVLGIAALAWAGFLVHSGVVQFDARVGAWRLNAGLVRVSAAGGVPDPEARRLLESARAFLTHASRLGFFPSPQLEARIASAASNLGDHEAAERGYRKAVELAPEFGYARFELARYALARGDVARGEAELRRVMKDAPRVPGAHEALADLLLNDGREEEAATLMEGLVRRKPEHAPFHRTLGLVLARLGQTERALEAEGRAVELDPRDPEAHYDRGRILANARRFEEALSSLERAVALSPGFAEGHYHAGTVAVQLGRRAVARRHLEAAARLEPGNAAYARAWTLFRRATGELPPETTDPDR